MPDPIPFPKPPSDEPGTHHKLKHEMVRLVAINAMQMVEDILDAFEDDEDAGFMVLAAAVATMAVHRFSPGPDKDEQVVETLATNIFEGVKELREEKH